MTQTFNVGDMVEFITDPDLLDTDLCTFESQIARIADYGKGPHEVVDVDTNYDGIVFVSLKGFGCSMYAARLKLVKESQLLEPYFDETKGDF